MKKFKLLKSIEPIDSINIGEVFEIYDDYVKLDELWKLHYTWFVTHWYIEEIKDTHFWNWMMFLEDHTNVFLLNTDYNPQSDLRIKKEQTANINDWCIFQTKEQAKNFDKMMMTVWKIWKWKKENDDGHIDRSDRDLKKYSLSYDFDGCSFLWIYGIFTCYDFILPRFTSKEKVIQLISDLWEEELNNLLCWIK